ncbi:MAG: COG1361 S-layer family protein, partial [archaeon]
MVDSGAIGSNRKILSIVIAALVVLTSSVGGVATFGTDLASAANDSNVVDGTPNLNASAPDARFEPSEDGTVSVSLTNDAEIDDNKETHPAEARTRAGEARSVDVNISDTREAPLTVRTNEQSAGTIQDGETGGPYAFDVLVDEDADPGTYEMDVTTKYRHAEHVSYEEVADGEYQYSEEVVNRTETDTVTVEIESEPDIEVDYENHDVPVGGEGIVSVAATNTGDESVTDATLSLTSSDSDLYFGSGTATSETDLGDLEAGETTVRRFRAGTVESAVNRPYSIDATVQYTDSEDSQGSQSDSFTIVPDERTQFPVRNLTHDVPQNGEGTVTMNVTHSAGKDIEDVTVTATATDGDVSLGSQGSSSAVQFDEWRANQSRQLAFRAETDEDAVNRSYPIELQFEYTDSEDNDNTR